VRVRLVLSCDFLEYLYMEVMQAKPFRFRAMSFTQCLSCFHVIFYESQFLHKCGNSMAICSQIGLLKTIHYLKKSTIILKSNYKCIL